MRPSRFTDTTIPSLGESGLASARGSSTSTPPCIIGAVIMKIIKSTSITSTSDVTFTSALNCISPRAGQPGDPMCQVVSVGCHFVPQHRLQGFQLGRRQGAAIGAPVLPKRAGAQLGVKGDRLAEETIVGRGGLLHDRVVGVL